MPTLTAAPKPVDPAIAAQFEMHTQARAEQQYQTRAGNCGTCRHLGFDVKLESGKRPYNQYESIPIRTNLRCGIGGFAVVTQGACNQFDSKRSTTTRSIK